MIIQSTLYNYQDTQGEQTLIPSRVYSELKLLGYVDNCKAQILFLLWDLKSHGLGEVKFAGGSQYNARILELRREGWKIINERSLNPIRSYYRLIDHARREQ
jgi:hypothetical protein